LGFVCCNWMTMGQLLSVVMMLAAVVLWPFFYAKDKKSTGTDAGETQ